MPSIGRSVYRSALLERLLQRPRLDRNAAPADAILSPRALLIWRQRPDLQQAFDLDHTDGRISLFWWYLLHAYAELGLPQDPNDDDISRAVNRPLLRLPRNGFTAITWLMLEIYRRHDTRFAPLRSDVGQQQLLAWFFAKALMERQLGAFLTPIQATGLCEAVEEGGAPRLTEFIWRTDEEVRARFTGPADAAFLAWCRSEGARDFPILSHPLVALAPPWRPLNRVSGRFGVNLIGHAFHRSGLSEDVRAAALSLEQAGVPFAIHNVGSPDVNADEDMSLSNRVSQELPFDTNLFCFTGESTVTAVLANPDLRRDRRYSIGMWPWELPEWPSFWRHAYDCVDEIWAASRFSYDAYARSAPVPVRHMPMAVTVDFTDCASRSDFGLPHNRFLFVFAFDGLSSFARKNPFACISAFKRAFPDQGDPVGLVIKGLRTKGTEAWAQLSGQIANDPRILPITDSLSRGRLLDLYRACDCFVSLHRSEGFGRNIAEAMALGKPVIVTAHSGNMDFTDSETAALVPVHLVRLGDGEYPFGDGQMWAEADIEAAAIHMRRMVADTSWRSKIAKTGRTRIQRLYTPAAVGQRWSETLHALPR